VRRFQRGTIASVFVASAVTAVTAYASVGSVAVAGQAPRGSSPHDTHVAVSDFLFDPTELSIARGDTVVFDFDGPSHHTATDSTGMELYDSGSVGEGGPSLSVTFEAAGTYRFVCTPHIGMGGRVFVPMRVAPKHAGVHHTFTATWATLSAPDGFVYDVHIRRPGKSWKGWRTGITDPQGSFTPTSGKGLYRFRARMRGLSGGQTMWSAQSKIRVG
jgi:plastocyanin